MNCEFLTWTILSLMKNKSKIFILSAVTLLLLQALTILLSWIVSALWPALNIKSLLSGSGLRWLLSGFAQNLSSEFLVWLIICSVFIGCFVWSELPKKIIWYTKNDYRERFAVNTFLSIVALAVILCVTMAVVPRSSFLSVSGHLYPGPFVRAACMILCMSIFGGSVAFLLLTGKVKDFETAEKACVFGLQSAVPVIIIYILLKQLLEMIDYVLL